MSIAVSLVDQLLELVRQQGACRVEEVELETGALQQVVPEALELAFTAASEGTAAQGATLKLVEVPAVAECQSCRHRFEPAIDDYRCPRCQRADVRVVAGNDIILKTVVCQTGGCGSAP